MFGFLESLAPEKELCYDISDNFYQTERNDCMETNSVFTKVMALISALIVLITTLAAISPLPETRRQVKNVIFMIGDGMGENSVNKAKTELSIELAMETMPLRGQSMTNSVGNVTTDSAAGGTALACGVSTINGYVGVYPEDPLHAFGHPISLTELAMSMGKKTGIVTTDSTGGATPATFSAHTSSRDNNEDIANQQIASNIDLVWGKSAGVIDEATAAANGKTLITTKTALMALTPDIKSYGQFTNDMWAKSIIEGDTPTLTEMTEKAIALLNTDDDGFFLMVEGAHIDKHSHNNDGEKMDLALQEFDNAVATALAFAEADGDTLVVVTADHETGAIAYTDGTYQYTSGSHSSANVPLFAYGCDDFIEQGEVIKNTKVPLYTAYAMGALDEQFPAKAS